MWGNGRIVCEATYQSVKALWWSRGGGSDIVNRYGETLAPTHRHHPQQEQDQMQQAMPTTAVESTSDHRQQQQQMKKQCQQRQQNYVCISPLATAGENIIDTYVPARAPRHRALHVPDQGPQTTPQHVLVRRRQQRVPRLHGERETRRRRSPRPIRRPRRSLRRHRRGWRRWHAVSCAGGGGW